MKKNFIIWFLLITILLSACQPTAPAVSGSVNVLAAETFLADIAQNVAGERFKVEPLIPVGLDPHAFEPTPQDIAKISESQILIVNGAGFESWLENIISNADGNRTIIEASAGLTSRSAREGEEAVMSLEEKSEELCTGLSDKTAEEKKQAGKDSASAVALHEEHLDESEEQHGEHEIELLTVQLNPQTGGIFGGFLKIEAEESGDFMIAAAQGSVKLTDLNGSEIEIEEKLTLTCAGLTQAVIAELEPGEYLLELDDFAAQTTPFLAGPAGGHHHHDGDPHFWLDPINVIRYVENIRDGLIAADPDGKDVYNQNAAAYIQQLNQLDQDIEKTLAVIPEERRLIVTNHESFGYFADRYNFKIIGTIIPSVNTGSAPSAQQLARLVEHIKNTNATSIFLETGTNPQLAEQISAETGVKVVTDLYTHSITTADGNAPNYIAMMKYNAQKIADALK